MKLPCVESRLLENARIGHLLPHFKLGALRARFPANFDPAQFRHTIFQSEHLVEKKPIVRCEQTKVEIETTTIHPR